MNILRTKDLYLQACRSSGDVHELTSEELKRLHQHLLRMYKDLEKLCIKYNLTVMLAYGSVLGSVRHGGFIPWDDDLDVFMPRKDYELLINKYAEELPRHLKIYAPNSRMKALSRFAKVVDIRTRFITATCEDKNDPSQGIFLDIFPLEYVSNRQWRNKVKKFISLVLMYIGTSVSQYKGNNKRYRNLMCQSKAGKVNYWIRQIIGLFFSFMNYQQWMNLIDKYSRCDKESDYVGEVLCSSRWKPMRKDIFLPAIEGSFEGTKVFLPHNPIAHLEVTYGNWQRIPLPEERWQHFIRKIVFPNEKD